MFKIITWNVNSIRARLGHLLRLLKNESPDTILLQETKCEDRDFPFTEIEEYGYNCATFGQKSYNGVAILSKGPLEDIQKGLSVWGARYLEAITYAGNKIMKIASVYVPNGGASSEEVKIKVKNSESKNFKYKMDFLDELYNMMQKEIKTCDPFIIGGDINIAPYELDVYSAKAMEGQICFLPEERKKFKAFINLGYTDTIRMMCGQQKIFSWYDYRNGALDTGKGLRIDHFLTSPIVTDRASGYKVLDEYRNLQKASDHIPMQLTINI